METNKWRSKPRNSIFYIKKQVGKIRTKLENPNWVNIRLKTSNFKRVIYSFLFGSAVFFFCSAAAWCWKKILRWKYVFYINSNLVHLTFCYFDDFVSLTSVLNSLALLSITNHVSKRVNKVYYKDKLQKYDEWKFDRKWHRIHALLLVLTSNSKSSKWKGNRYTMRYRL